MVMINPLARALALGMLATGLVVELLIVILEHSTPHGTVDATRAMQLMTHGPLAKTFYAGVIGGGLLPLAMIVSGWPMLTVPAAILALLGVLLSSHVWVKAPQLIPLS